MKLAILGSSPIALEAALRFHLHGASLTWFNFEEVEYESYFPVLKDHYVSEAGKQLLGSEFRAPVDFHSWKADYYNPLMELMKKEQKIRPHEVVSVTKRYLAPFEELQGKSRFIDLFRVIFEMNPVDFIKEQEANNPETFQRLTEELKTSLQTKLEMFEDFDLVLDLRRASAPASLSITGRALGESRIPKDHIKYGFESLSMARLINQEAGNVREIILIGSGEVAAEIVVSLSDWLKDNRSRLFVVSEESWPFEKYLKHGEKAQADKLNDVLIYMEGEFEKEVEEFHHKLREWQGLDDFVQAKMSKPVEPIPRLVYFSGHNATAVDMLVDRRRLFLTLEKPDFREGNKQADNNGLELKTIGADRIFVANKNQKPRLDTHLVPDETGYFDFECTLPNIAGAWSKDLEKLKGIENEIFKLFSPAGTH